MSDLDVGAAPPRVPSLGQIVFALTMIWLGLLGLERAYLPPAWAGVPDSFPGHAVVAYLCATISLVSGLGLLSRRTTLPASALLLATYLLWFLVVRVSHIFTAPTALDTWWGFGDTFVMGSAPLILYAGAAGPAGRWSFPPFLGARGVRIARCAYGIAMIPFGIAHFLYLKETAALVPSYLPWHTAIAFGTGCAFLAAGVAMLTGVYARLAATLSFVQMAGFTILCWVPVVIAGPNAGQWAEFINSVALTAAAWVMAESYRGIPWRGVGQR